MSFFRYQENFHPEHSHQLNSPLVNPPPRKISTQKIPTWKIPTHVFKYSQHAFFLFINVTVIIVAGQIW